MFVSEFFGGVAEWSKALVLKTSEGKNFRGFESHPLRHFNRYKTVS